MLYVDTSVLVAGLTNETATERVQTWLGEQGSDELAISRWVTTEFSAALSVKVRMGTMAPNERAEALAAFRSLVDLSFRVLAVESHHFDTAALLADQSATGLRAGDALHLAVALGQDATLCTLDNRLAGAAGAVGAQARLI
jgi:hypothetical protein